MYVQYILDIKYYIILFSFRFLFTHAFVC